MHNNVQATPKVSQDNRIIIRIWTSKDNKQFPGNNVGHISIETPNQYISLWPVPFTQEQYDEYKASNTLKQHYLKYFMERNAQYHRNYQEDVTAEGNIEPQVVICLYSLDVDAIEKAFPRLVNEINSWRLIGSNMFVQSLESLIGFYESEVGKKSVDNCASLALKMLKAGGIGRLISTPENSSFASKTSSSVSPDQILDLVIPAKIAEYDKYVLTRGYIYEGETPISTLKKNDKVLEPSSCIMM